MKKIIFPIIVLVLSGCSGFAILKYDSHPVVKATIAEGATKSSVIAAGGAPETELKVAKNQGSCLNYTLHVDGNSSPFYVVLNKQNQVTNYGYTTCETALKENHAMPTEPMKQKY